MFEKQVKKMKMLDWALTKLGVATFVLFLIGIWGSLRNWALSVNPWIFFIISIITAAIVLARIFRK